MPGRVYLDSSALVKRYAVERGSDVIAAVFDAATMGHVRLCFSFWNVGEVLGVLQRNARRAGKPTMYDEAKAGVHDELRRLGNLGILDIVDVSDGVLVDTWELLERHHLYEADALQIASARHLSADLFLTSDRRLRLAARKESLIALDVERQPKKVRQNLEALGNRNELNP